MRAAGERQWAKDLVGQDLNDCEVARRTGIPRGTIRGWRAAGFATADREFQLGVVDWRRYAYLLGIYLGDGHIAHGRGGVYALRVYLDSRYPMIVGEVAEAMESIFPAKSAWGELHRSAAMVKLQMDSKHWPALFPQHGPGMKHTRPIVLTPWQREIVGDTTSPTPPPDIRALFCESCDALGIAWRRMNARNISVARREAVAALDEFVGPKA